MKYYSQYGQDKWLNENLFKNKKDGFFIEVGADNGIRNSNTKFFEDLGWNGICVEPSPDRFAILSENRNCILENVAISNNFETVDFLDIRGFGRGLSGIVKHYDKRHKHRINQAKKHPHHKSHNVIQVPCTTFTSIFEKHNITKADFCTIDTEGNELEILKSLDFDRFEIKAILVENNYQDSKIRQFLHEVGYKFSRRIKVDDVFLKS